MLLSSNCFFLFILKRYSYHPDETATTSDAVMIRGAERQWERQTRVRRHYPSGVKNLDREGLGGEGKGGVKTTRGTATVERE